MHTKCTECGAEADLNGETFHNCKENVWMEYSELRWEAGKKNPGEDDHWWFAKQDQFIYGWIDRQAKERGIILDSEVRHIMRIIIKYEVDLSEGYEYYCNDVFEKLEEMAKEILYRNVKEEE
jgi:hypothetical protein